MWCQAKSKYNQIEVLSGEWTCGNSLIHTINATILRMIAFCITLCAQFLESMTPHGIIVIFLNKPVGQWFIGKPLSVMIWISTYHNVIIHNGTHYTACMNDLEYD